ncbi:MAG: prepilin-type N-terminal cleavage/methylation domain-containing protein [Planctomycetes bacterium]|nr:prepilin-type N-terminal cleavage/methylation domain-containing protein [Planctomycetota bacterium]
MHTAHKPAPQSGFSLTELSVVVAILGILALIGVPKFQTVVEGSKAQEAFIYLAHIQGAQERYNARSGVYAKKISDLDIEIDFPKHFRMGTLTSFNWETQWQLRIFRSGPSGGSGGYSVCFNQDGYSPVRSSIPADYAPGRRGGHLTPGNTVPPSPKPSGRIHWSKDTPMDYDEYVDRIFDANTLDYKKGKDQMLDTMLWLGHIIDQIFERDTRTQDEWTEDFFDLDRDEYKAGDDYWLDVVLRWHYNNMKYTYKW